MLCVVPLISASVMSEALSLSLLQPALTLLDIHNEQDVDADLDLAWDPLSEYNDAITQLLADDCLTVGQIALHIS